MLETLKVDFLSFAERTDHGSAGGLEAASLDDACPDALTATGHSSDAYNSGVPRRASQS